MAESLAEFIVSGEWNAGNLLHALVSIVRLSPIDCNKVSATTDIVSVLVAA